MVLTVEQLEKHLQDAGRSEILGISLVYGEVTVTVKRDGIEDFLTYLRDDAGLRFIQLMDICGVDYPSRPARFEVVYHLLSLHKNCRIRVKLSTDEETLIPSVTDIFPTADWFEREVFDMYGIAFIGHPDMRRILTDYGFSGYPLRKDFPVMGYVELRYDEEKKRVSYDQISLTQDFRNFDFLSPWEGAKYVMSEEGAADNISSKQG